MNKLLARLNNTYRRASFVVIGFFLAFAGLLPSLILTSGNASAANQVPSRSITMSNSAPGATGVTYTVTFTPQTNEVNPDVLVDFCSNDPLIGDTCTATAGTDTPNFTSAAASGWTLSTIGGGRGVKLTTTGITFTSGTPTTISITNVTNPSNSGVSGSFYGRILVFATGGAGTFTSVTATGYVDYGGIALSTAQNISVTSKVFETLSFCVFNSSCGTPAVLDLGNATTGALSTSTAYVNSGASYSIATNAYHGAVVTMTGTTLCNQSPLNFTNCPHGASNNTIVAAGTSATTSTPGSAQFGMCAYNGGNAAITVTSTYNDTVNNCNGITTGAYSGSSLFGFDDTNTTGTNSTSGSEVMSSTGPLLATTGNFAFIGNISSTTTAGIYNSDLNLVATGTF